MSVNILYLDFSTNFGGSTVCLHNLISSLNKNEYKAVITCIFHRDKTSISKYLNSKNAAVIDIGGFNNRMFLRLLGFIDKHSKLLKKIGLYNIGILLAKIMFERIPTLLKILYLIKKKKIKLLHVNNGINFPAIIASFISRIPCVCTVRSFPSNNYIHKIALRKKISIVSVSKAIRKDFIKKNKLTGQDIKTIYDGIEIESIKQKIRKTKNEIRNFFNINNPERLIGTVGRLVPWKRQDLLISAVEKLNKKGFNIKCLFVGEAEKDTDSVKYEQSLKRMVINKNLQNNIIFAGFSNNVLEILNALDILVLPSIVEPFGMVVLEAMALGVPVVAFNKGGPSEIITHKENGLLVPVGDIDGLAESIQLLFSDKKLYDSILKKSYTRLKKEFSLEETVKKYSELYESAVKQ